MLPVIVDHCTTHCSEPISEPTVISNVAYGAVKPTLTEADEYEVISPAPPTATPSAPPQAPPPAADTVYERMN